MCLCLCVYVHVCAPWPFPSTEMLQDCRTFQTGLFEKEISVPFIQLVLALFCVNRLAASALFMQACDAVVFAHSSLHHRNAASEEGPSQIVLGFLF